MMPSRSTNQESIRACFKAQESTSGIFESFLGDFDLSPIYETEEDAIAALDAIDIGDIDSHEELPKIITPVSVPVIQAALDVDDEAAIERLEAVTAIYTPAWKDAARIWRVRFEAGEAARKKQIEAFAQRKKAITAARRLIANRERMALRRASPAILKAMRLKALLKLTAKASGNRFLEKIVGREAHLVQFRDAMATDTGASLSKLADIYERITGDPMTKRQAQNRRDIVEKLEAKGGIWHRWK